MFANRQLIRCGQTGGNFPSSRFRFLLSSHKRFKAGDDVEQFFVDGFLSNPVQRAVQLLRNVFDVPFRALHGR